MFLKLMTTCVALTLLNLSNTALAQSKQTPDCASQEIVNYIKSGLRKSTLDDGRRVSSIARTWLRGTPETISVSRKQLVCKMNIAIRQQGRTRTLPSTAVIKLRANGAFTATITWGG